MVLLLPDDHHSKLKVALFWAVSLTLVCGVFFLGLFFVGNNRFIQNLINKTVKSRQYEIFGFAPYWSLSKMENIDWNTLTIFAYFSLPVTADGSIDHGSFEFSVFEGSQLAELIDRAKDHQVKRVITLTQMEAPIVESFLANPEAWNKIADESIRIIKEKDLDGVNIDFEYIPTNDYLRGQFSRFVDSYTKILKEKLNNPYITVSVLASSARFDKIYDIGYLAKVTDGIFVMAYDYYYPGSKTAGPTAPLYGFNNGKGPYWYDVSTAIEDFLKVADSGKIILGVPYYGWSYPVESPKPGSERIFNLATLATTKDKEQNNRLIAITPAGGWDNLAQVSWRGYWDKNGWHVVYLEDKKSLSKKYDFAKEKNLSGVGIWALGYDNGDNILWAVLSDKFAPNKKVVRVIKSPTQL